MKKFPEELKVENKENFGLILVDKCIKKLRQDIYSHILKGEENNYFSIDTWVIKNYKNNLSTTQSIILEQIIPELEDLGWKCKLSFGNTGLFIYSTENPPPSCW